METSEGTMRVHAEPLRRHQMSTLKLASNRTVYLSNFGMNCEMSAASYSRVLEFLRTNGFLLSSKIEESNYALVNSCCVIADTRKDVMDHMKRLLQYGHIEKIILFGCLSGVDYQDSEKIIAVSSKEIETLDNCFEGDISIQDIIVHHFAPLVFTPYQKNHDVNVVNLLISQGCDNRCSYCNIKNAKGSTRSKPARDICSEVKASMQNKAMSGILKC